MLTIDIQPGHGVAASILRIAEDVTDDKQVYQKHIVRIGRTEKEYDTDILNVDWLCEIHVNSIRQAQDYADIFQSIANKMTQEALEEEENKEGTDDDHD